MNSRGVRIICQDDWPLTACPCWLTARELEMGLTLADSGGY